MIYRYILKKEVQIFFLLSCQRFHIMCFAISLGEHVRLCQENQATRGKMEQLQAMMEERRMRRKARRESRAPYSTWLMGKNMDSLHGCDDQMGLETNMETSLQEQVDAHDSSSYTELKQETIVAWTHVQQIMLSTC